MHSRGFHLPTAALAAALGAAAMTAVSIAVFQILLGLAVVLILAARLPLRPPRHWPWLALFAALTVASILASDLPRAGLPQIRKFFVWLMLFAVASTFSQLKHARWLTTLWLAGGTLSALWAIGQFVVKYRAAASAGQNFYLAYVGDRITGFNSHWMTFSGQMMIVLLSGAALLLWGNPERRLRAALLVCLPIVALALTLAFTRGVWLATIAAAVYLLWCWRRWTVALLPAAALLALAFGPAALRERALSLVKPHTGQTDSNLHRVYTFRTGLEIIKAHPLLGLGPERIGPHFVEYVPADLPKQLPEGYYAHLHNIYVHFAAERGLPALLALLAFFALTARDWLVRLRTAPPAELWLLRSGLAILIGVFSTGLFEHNLGDSEVLAMTLAALAQSESGDRRDVS